MNLRVSGKLALLGAGIAILAGLGGIWWFGFAATAEMSHMQPDNAALVVEGGSLYATQCASCHGKNLEGQTANWRQRLPDGSIAAPPHDESGHSWHHPGAMLFDVTKHGRFKASGGTIRTNMPGFEETLSDRQIWAVLSYIKSRWPTEVQRRHDAIDRQGHH